ncbi:MAG TPA: sugar porter family MFS transporter [Chloroflexia bacterium]|nr:sugar porter family MFS transporter [Chloroflexia bacterium]
MADSIDNNKDRIPPSRDVIPAAGNSVSPAGNLDNQQNQNTNSQSASNNQQDKNQPSGKKTGKFFVYFVSALAAFNGLLFGFDTGVISGALLFIKKDYNLNSTMQEVVTSAVLVGAVIGAAIAGFLTDRLGRRITIIGTAVVFVIGAISTSLAPFLWWLIISRGVVGLGIGVASFIGPLYISELAPPKARGSMVTYNQLAVTVGILVAYLVDLAFSPAGAWRWMFAVHVIPATILGIGMIFVPDSPRFLVLKGKEKKAREVLNRIRPKGGVDEELQDIKEKTQGEEKQGWKELFSPMLRVALIVGIGLAILQQVTGINTVIYYAPTIFREAGINSNTSSILATTIVGVVNVLFTIVAVLLMDRVGRRPLLLIGVAGMVIGLAGLGVVFLFNANGGLAWFAIGCTLFYTASFAIGLGPVFWLLISEIYPTKVRGRANSIATVANWAANLVVALTFLTLFDLIGKPGTFWLYAVIGIGTWVFSFFLVPETKGKSLEDIEDYWQEKSNSSNDKNEEKSRRGIHGSGPMPQS